MRHNHHKYKHLAYRSKFFETIKSASPGGAQGGAQEKWNKPCFPDEEDDNDDDEEDVDENGDDDDVDLM